MKNIYFFRFFSVLQQKNSRDRESARMRPIESNYNEKLKHDSFLRSVVFFCVFLFCLILYNTCVNIFVILKAPGEEGSRLVPERRRRLRRERERKKERKISLNSVEQPNKNYTEYLSSMLFLFDFSFPSADQRLTTHVPHKSPCRNISDETP